MHVKNIPRHWLKQAGNNVFNIMNSIFTIYKLNSTSYNDAHNYGTCKEGELNVMER
jgi:hypothetical protein